VGVPSRPTACRRWRFVEQQHAVDPVGLGEDAVEVLLRLPTYLSITVDRSIT